MALYPDVQRKAQAALDAVVGPGRLPDFGDSDALPYIHAIVREALRWHVVVPLGVPHRTMRDDEFHGYFVPAGTNVLPNAWAMLHDPAAYPDPDEFRPERFMRDGQLDLTAHDPALFAFGFGRRICPGRYFAFTSLFITVASVLHVFDIGPPFDADGAPIPIKFQQTSELLS
ncbi:O-methylsterigmatocystin oxidoreductase [Trametes pubescens]|uniref:O-methylsterigmatocystin oxidoreductase n=1 Tax=Trametes pubescens TaxID=154538 RepID=A0A1M2W195_TRAPU|nr:O-methylsterigmatocystin oxidoreductase [Trametes pubescens]